MEGIRTHQGLGFTGHYDVPDDRVKTVGLYHNNLTSVNLPDGVEWVALDTKTKPTGTLAIYQREFL